LAVTSGVAEGDRAREAIENYPTWPAGSPVIWPERADQPIYHNRAIWPFVSAYALRAARTVNDPDRIEHELRSIMRGAAMSGSNMENYELMTQSTHVDEGKLSGPVVDSPRQLWSVAAYLDMVSEGVFGLTQSGHIEPKLPTTLVPMLFGRRDRISLQMPDRTVTLVRPSTLHGNLLVAGNTRVHGLETIVTLKAVDVPSAPLHTDATLYAPASPDAPEITAEGKGWRVKADGKFVLYADGQRIGKVDGNTYVAQVGAPPCFSATRVDEHGVESLHSPTVCAADPVHVSDRWPRHWTASATGSYRVALRFENNHGPITTGVTAAVKMLVVSCDGSATQRVPIVMPHSVGEQTSTYAIVTASHEPQTEPVVLADLEHVFRLSRHPVRLCAAERQRQPDLPDARRGRKRHPGAVDRRAADRADRAADHRLLLRSHLEPLGAVDGRTFSPAPCWRRWRCCGCRIRVCCGWPRPAVDHGRVDQRVDGALPRLRRRSAADQPAPLGYAMQSFFIGVGAVSPRCSLICWRAFGVANVRAARRHSHTVKYAFYIGGASYCWLRCSGPSLTREYPPEQLRKRCRCVTHENQAGSDRSRAHGNRACLAGVGCSGSRSAICAGERALPAGGGLIVFGCCSQLWLSGTRSKA
jgi:hypothetical protein